MADTEYSYLVDHYRLSDEDCNKPVSKEHFEELSSLCEPWRKLPQYLGLKPNVEGDMERDFRTEEEKRVGFIKKWKQRNGFDATFKMLIKALLHIKSRLVVSKLRPYQSLWQKLRPNLSRQRSGTALKLLWKLLANVLSAGTCGYWQQMKTTEDLEGLELN